MRGKRLRVAITLGDPAGIGPEIALKAALSNEVREACVPVLVGSAAACRQTAERLGLDVPIREISEAGEIEDAGPTVWVLCPPASRGVPPPPVGEISAAGGQLAYEAVDEAVRLVLGGALDALCTAPLSKAALHLAGHPWPGHTEMLAEKTNSPLVAMLMIGGGLRVVPATIHHPLASVPSLLETERIERLLELIARSMAADFGIEHPRIAVCGLNPHAGEGGLLGSEEERIISPAVEHARAEGLSVEGPLPADVVFYQMLRGRWDVVLAMYHDQAMIPVKTLAFDRGVNVTLGLPFVRTSPDHGTAFDIAGRGTADPTSLIEAVRLAVELTTNRRSRGTKRGTE